MTDLLPGNSVPCIECGQPWCRVCGDHWCDCPCPGQGKEPGEIFCTAGEPLIEPTEEEVQKEQAMWAQKAINQSIKLGKETPDWAYEEMRRAADWAYEEMRRAATADENEAEFAGGKSIAVPAGRPLVEVFAPLLADYLGADVAVWSKPESNDDSDD